MKKGVEGQRGRGNLLAVDEPPAEVAEEGDAEEDEGESDEVGAEVVGPAGHGKAEGGRLKEEG